MERRNFLKKAGGIGVGLTVAGSGALASMGSAAASSFNFNAGKASVATHNGDVSEVFINPSGNVTWENFDESIEQARVTIKSRIVNRAQDVQIRGWELVYQETLSMGSEAGHTGSVTNPGLGPITLYGGDTNRPTSDFDEPTDGEVKEVVVQLDITVELLDANGNVADPNDEAVLQDTAAFLATSTNLEATSSGSGTANTGMN